MTTHELPQQRKPAPEPSVVLRRLRSPMVEHVEVDGETVIYELGRDRLHLLDPIATLVWQMLDGASSLGAVSRTLAEAFDGSPEQVLEDVRTFAEHLESLGVVERLS